MGRPIRAPPEASCELLDGRSIQRRTIRQSSLWSPQPPHGPEAHGPSGLQLEVTPESADALATAAEDSESRSCPRVVNEVSVHTWSQFGCCNRRGLEGKPWLSSTTSCRPGTRWLRLGSCWFEPARREWRVWRLLGRRGSWGEVGIAAAEVRQLLRRQVRLVSPARVEIPLPQIRRVRPVFSHERCGSAIGELRGADQRQCNRGWRTRARSSADVTFTLALTGVTVQGLSPSVSSRSAAVMGASRDGLIRRRPSLRPVLAPAPSRLSRRSNALQASVALSAESTRGLIGRWVGNTLHWNPSRQATQ